MGAPFWFDVLNKVMVIRSTVKPHEKSPEEASEDRQGPSKGTADAENTAAVSPGVSPSAPPTRMANVAPDTDGERDVDACDVDATTTTTPDDKLPPGQGGVA
jgi:hypothetical protein